MSAHYIHVEKFITRRARVWIPRMGLSHWEIRQVFLDSVDETEGEYATTAETIARWSYLQAKIKWYLPNAVRRTDRQLEETLVHELCHVVLSPEQTLVIDRLVEGSDGTEQDKAHGLMMDRVELSTEQMTRALVRAYA